MAWVTRCGLSHSAVTGWALTWRRVWPNRCRAVGSPASAEPPRRRSTTPSAKWWETRPHTGRQCLSVCRCVTFGAGWSHPRVVTARTGSPVSSGWAAPMSRPDTVRTPNAPRNDSSSTTDCAGTGRETWPGTGRTEPSSFWAVRTIRCRFADTAWSWARWKAPCVWFPEYAMPLRPSSAVMRRFLLPRCRVPRTGRQITRRCSVTWSPDTWFRLASSSSIRCR